MVRRMLIGAETTETVLSCWPATNGAVLAWFDAATGIKQATPDDTGQADDTGRHRTDGPGPHAPILMQLLASASSDELARTHRS